MIKIKELKKLKRQFVLDILTFCLRDFMDVYRREYGTTSPSLAEKIYKHLYELQYEVEIRDGQAVGFIGYSDEGDHIQLHDQAVIPELRGTGLNIKLLQRLETRAKEQGKKYMMAKMHRVQGDIIKMALKFGYAITSYQKHFLVIKKVL